MRLIALLLTAATLLAACTSAGTSTPSDAPAATDAPVRTDTSRLQSIPEGEFTFNVPCRVVSIHPEIEGKAILFLWLHGGVCDTSKHSFFSFNHLDCCEADDMILDYLRRRGIKAIALFPVSHQSSVSHCVTWKECYPDVKHIIDDFVNKGLIDTDRIYLAGSSDGGTGTWDYVENYPELFAAAIAMSCNRPRFTTVPTYFFNTASESDCSQQVADLQKQGSKILRYKYGANYKHGDDAAECTDALLDEYFSFKLTH